MLKKACPVVALQNVEENASGCSPQVAVKKLTVGPKVLRKFLRKNPRPPLSPAPESEGVESLVVSYQVEHMGGVLKSVEPSTSATGPVGAAALTDQHKATLSSPSQSASSLTTASPSNSPKLIKTQSKRVRKKSGLTREDNSSTAAASRELAASVEGQAAVMSASHLADCLVHPSSFINYPFTISLPAASKTTPSSLTYPPVSPNTPPIIESNTPLLDSLTTPTLLDSLTRPSPANDMEGLANLFSFEECVQTATKEEAVEPLENGQQEIVVSYSQNDPVVPETREDVARTHSPPGTAVPGQGHRGETGTAAQDIKPARKRGRPRKTDANISAKVLLNKDANPVKRRGRPRKHTICVPSLAAAAAAAYPLKKRGRPRKSGTSQTVSVKQEPVDFDRSITLPHPPDIQPYPSGTKLVTKKDKKTHGKSIKTTAAMITKVFEKPSLLPRTNSTNQTLTEDLGYCTYISGSDSGSRSSHIPVSHSPDVNMASPATLDYLQPALGFDDSNQSNVLIKDTVLSGSSLQDSPLDQNEDITVNVLELGQGPGSGSNQSAVPQEPVLVTNTAAVPSDRDLMLQLDELLKDEASPMFTEDMMIGDTQEVTTYEDEEDILNSETVTDCLKELQLCGRISGPSHLSSEPPPPDPKDTRKGAARLRRMKRASCSHAPTRKNTKLCSPGTTTPAEGVRVLSMVHSRTKSGRVSKPSARMMEFITKSRSLDSPSSSEGRSAPKESIQKVSNSLAAEPESKETGLSTQQAASSPVTPRPSSPASSAHTPVQKTPVVVKLKDLRLSLTRSPVCGQKLTNFSFKLPELTASPLSREVTRKVSISETAENRDPTPYKRIVTIEPTPPLREVRYKGSEEPLPEETADTAVGKVSAAASSKSLSNTLNMSLDAILKEMDEAKQAQQVKQAKSHDIRVVEIRSHDQIQLSQAKTERMVRFASPDFDGSLTDKDISELLCPLDVDSSLDQLLRGDSLFGESQESGEEEEVGVALEEGEDLLRKSSAMLSPLSPGDRKVRFRELEETTPTNDRVVVESEVVPTCVPDTERTEGETPPPGDEMSTLPPKTPVEAFSFKLPDTPSDDVDPGGGATAVGAEREADKVEESVTMRTVTYAQSVEEDLIDLYADDADLFDSDVKDTPLSNLFKRSSSAKSAAPSKRGALAKTTPTSQLKKPSVGNRIAPSERNYERGSSPGYDNPPCSMPYKKQQVSQWVAEQQRRIANIPHPMPPARKFDRPVLVPWGLNRNGNSSIEPQFVNGPPPFFNNPPTIPPPPPQGSKDQWVGSVLEGHCRNFLRGRCDFINCRFRHTLVTMVPMHIMEAALFQGTPVDLPMEVLCRYSNDLQSCSELQAHQRQFYDLIQGLLNKQFSMVASAYHYFSATVQFNKLLLIRVLELSSVQPPSLVRALAVAEKVYSDLCLLGGLGREVYYYYIKTLANFDIPAKMMEAYQAMRSKGEPPNYDIIIFLLRLGKALEHRVIGLLDDLEICSPPLSDIETARCANRLVDVADPSLLLKHACQLGIWLDHASANVLNKFTVETFNKLRRVFTQEKRWASLVSLLYGCSKNLPPLKSNQLCETFNFAVMSLGASEKVADILGMLNEEQLVGISSEVWNRVITDCAQQARVQKARLFYRVATAHKKQLSISPSLKILQSLLDAHSKHKSHKTLAEVVRLSLEHNVILDRLFYQKVLVELRQWGRDQDAISTVYKALRRVENLDVSDGSIRSGVESMELVSSPEVLPGNPPDPPVSSQRSLPTPMPVKPVPRHPISDVRGAGGVVKSGKTPSLDNVLAQSSSLDQSGLISLIEVNGSQGQLGAVASILVSLPRRSSRYDNQMVQAVWRAITKSNLRAANAFSNLLTCLSQSRSHSLSAPSTPSQTTPSQSTSSQSTPSQSALLPSDRWLVSQVGVALLKCCESEEDWQSGFVVLHHLHRFGIHYVKLSQPSACLPPCMPHPPTPCSVALTAINVCMHMDQVSGALEVMQGCGWIQASSTLELNTRTMLLTEMVEKFLQLKQSGNAWKCLQAVGTSVMKKYLHVVTNLHNKLLQTVLSSNDLTLAQDVYCSMRDKKLQCLPTYFSSLVESLCSNEQESVARALCQSAIKNKCYCDLSKESLFHVALPVGLVRMELHLLLEDHLRKIADGVAMNRLQPLVVQFSSGSRSTLEEVFSTNFDPRLDVSFSSRGTSVSIPVSSLRAWVSHRSPSRPEGEDMATPLNRDSATPLLAPMRAHSIKPFLSSSLQQPHPSPSADPQNMESCDSVKETDDETSVSHEHHVTSSEVAKSPPPAITAETRPPADEADQETRQRRPIRLRRKRTLSEVNTTADDSGSNASKRLKAEKKQFKEVVCRMFMDQLKPHYQAGKFRTPEDYTHLLRILSLDYFKTYKSRGEPPSNEEMNAEVVTIVAGLMPRIEVYSKDMDDALGLAGSGTDS